MNTPRCLLTFACVFLVTAETTQAAENGLVNTSHSSHAAFTTVGMADAVWTGGLWSDRFAQHQAMLDNEWDLYFQRAFQNFKIAAGMEAGEFYGTPWHDGDFYKWLESMAWVYGVTKDPALDRRMDDIIAVIARAQMADGYIDTPIQINRGWYVGGFDRKARWQPAKRWTNRSLHEVYNFGHLFTSACVHCRATGKRNFLDVAVKAADQMYEVFHDPSPELDQLNYNPSHIMGLVELYRTTGNEKYRQLAQTILDMRGTARPGDAQNQTRQPFRQLQEAYGHAVLGTYLYAGAADLYLETGEPAVGATLQRLEDDVLGKRLYITGGCTAVHSGEAQQYRNHVHEAFGRDYDLPSATAYNESCANIGFALWQWRMLMATGDARYADTMELVWYNNLPASINLQGTRFFYANPLRWYGADHKLLSSDWPERWGKERLGICCPPNIVRTILEMNNYAYGVSDNAVWVHLYGSNRLDTKLPDGSRVALEQQSQYPWDGTVRLTMTQAPARAMTLKLRIPGWAKDATIRVNGEPVTGPVTPQSYRDVARTWKTGDTVTLNLPMPVMLVEGNRKVEALRNQIAVKRGPVVYCLESTDLPENVDVMDVAVPVDNDLRARFDANLLGGLSVITGTATVLPVPHRDDRLYRTLDPVARRTIPVTLIPYYAWNNRGRCAMTVWVDLDL